MDQLPSSSKVTWLEKLIRYGPIIAAIGVGFWCWGTISNFVVHTLENTLYAVLLGTPLVILLGSMIFYPMAWWMGYKTLCKKITSIFIKMDPLSYMDRYADTLSDKLANLNKTKIELQGRKIAAERRLEHLNREIEEHSKKGATALKMKQMDVASLEGSRLEGAKNSIRMYTPNYERMKKSLDFLEQLSTNWGTSIVLTREEIARKREEFIVLRDEAKALGQAEEFLSGDTEAGRIYKESLVALEETMTHRIAYIEDFEKRAEPILKGIQVDNQMQHDDGLAALQAYMKDSTIVLPNSTTPLFHQKVAVQDVIYEEVGKKPNGFNLLD